MRPALRGPRDAATVDAQTSVFTHEGQQNLRQILGRLPLTYWDAAGQRKRTKHMLNTNFSMVQLPAWGILVGELRENKRESNNFMTCSEASWAYRLMACFLFVLAYDVEAQPTLCRENPSYNEK